MPKVSVIVPIYNVERYLRNCVDSLLAQTLDDVEIVLVDDGSPDESGRIADEYAGRCGNVVCIHQENAGLGPARNTGIRHASGDYVGFVDSDDWAEPEMFERLYSEAVRTGADIVVSGHCDVTDGVKTVSKVHPLAGQVISGERIIEVRKNLYGHGAHDPVRESFPMSVCMSLYRRSSLNVSNVRFFEILSEDIFFNLLAYKSARTIAFIGATDYCYRKDGQVSITGSFNARLLNRYNDFIQLLDAMASKEIDVEGCRLRVRRTAVDYVRLYVGIVEESNLSARNKCREVKRLIASSIFGDYCSMYPRALLPRGQRFFQWLLVNDMPRSALSVMKMRLLLKRLQRRH